MDVVWTGPIVSGTTNYKLSLYLNDVQYTNLDGFTVDGPGLVTEDLTFEAHVVDVVPTGFPATYTGAVTIEVINGQSADPLTV